jgi:hypothetical protein
MPEHWWKWCQFLLGPLSEYYILAAALYLIFWPAFMLLKLLHFIICTGQLTTKIYITFSTWICKQLLDNINWICEQLLDKFKCQGKRRKNSRETRRAGENLRNRKPPHAYLRAWILEASTGITFSFEPFWLYITWHRRAWILINFRSSLTGGICDGKEVTKTFWKLRQNID